MMSSNLAKRGGGYRAAGAADLEELGLRELPGLDRVRDEHRLDMRVLAAQPLHDPEEERLCEPPVALGHARRHVHREEHDRFGRRALAQRELPVTQIVVRERRVRPVARRGA